MDTMTEKLKDKEKHHKEGPIERLTKMVQRGFVCTFILLFAGGILLFIGGYLFVNLDKKVDRIEHGVEKLVNKFEEHRLYDKTRINVLKFVSGHTVICGSGSVVHYVTYDGDPTFGRLFAGITVAHHNCPNSMPDSDVITCEDIDMAMYRQCPPIGLGALSVDDEADPDDGDRVVAFGNHLAWAGTYAGKYARALKPGSAHWRGEGAVIVNIGEFEVDGLQHQGQSGTAAVGRCGYIGIAHANTRDGGTLIIPRDNVVECMLKHAHELSTLACACEVVHAPKEEEC